MGYPRHLLFVFGGTQTNAAEAGEIWQCGIRGGPAAGSAHDYGDEDAMLAAIQGPFKTWYGAVASSMRSDYRLEYLKLNEIAPDGSYADATTTHRFDYGTFQAGGVTPSVPSILTLAWSWKTARLRGIASKGRIFPPVAFTTTQGSPRVSSAVTATNVTAAKALLSVLSKPNGVDFEFAPCVVSAGSHGGTGTGAIENITGVRVGDVVDVQRRRKNALVDVYATSVWP
jgi:hypothetical protein